jgi:hypothetical protein
LIWLGDTNWVSVKRAGVNLNAVLSANALVKVALSVNTSGVVPLAHAVPTLATYVPAGIPVPVTISPTAGLVARLQVDGAAPSVNTLKPAPEILYEVATVVVDSTVDAPWVPIVTVALDWKPAPVRTTAVVDAVVAGTAMSEGLTLVRPFAVTVKMAGVVTVPPSEFETVIV